jgi:hypothetical protein
MTTNSTELGNPTQNSELYAIPQRTAEQAREELFTKPPQTTAWEKTRAMLRILFVETP